MNVHSRIDKILALITILILGGLVFEGIYLYFHWPRGDEPNPPTPVNQELVIPEEMHLEIPFTSQAPFGDWRYPFNHNCEEASVLMIHYFLEGKTVIDPAFAKKELLDLVDYETKKYGFHQDTTAEQTAQLIRDYYGYKAKVLYNSSLEDIKKELVQGNPVILPAAGRLLKNPYFTPPGPIYHMLVIKGYTINGFITNDPGTSRGANYFYPYDIIMGAMHDWNSGDTQNGKPVIISIQK